MAKQTNKAKVVQEYIARFSDAKGQLTVPKKELAKRVMAAYPDLFMNLRNAQNVVGYYTGAYGTKNRKSFTNQGGAVQLSTIREGLEKAGVISTYKPMRHVHLPIGKYLVMSDIHIPFHDMDAVSVAVHHGLRKGVDGIVLNGDIMDCYNISKFTKELDRPELDEEIDMTKKFFEWLRGHFPGQKIWYKIGNHEERLRHYILNNASKLGRIAALEIHELLEFKRFGIQRVDREIIKAGKLNILHGHEMPTGIISPVNPARGTFIKALANTLHGHNHQISKHRQNTLEGKGVVVHTTGCLCHLSPEYYVYGGLMKWQHGAAIVEVLPKGNFTVENFEIIDGEVYN